jgi:hypothetical protein
LLFVPERFPQNECHRVCVVNLLRLCDRHRSQTLQSSRAVNVARRQPRPPAAVTTAHPASGVPHFYK